MKNDDYLLNRCSSTNSTAVLGSKAEYYTIPFFMLSHISVVIILKSLEKVVQSVTYYSTQKVIF